MLTFEIVCFVMPIESRLGAAPTALTDATRKVHCIIMIFHDGYDVKEEEQYRSAKEGETMTTEE